MIKAKNSFSHFRETRLRKYTKITKKFAEIFAELSLDMKLVYVFPSPGFYGLDQGRVPDRHRTQRTNHF
jgi:hypothetical protein